MKVSSLFLGAGLLLLACEGLDGGDTAGSFRSDRLPPASDDTHLLHTDTTLYLSAVRVNEGYDWHRDTACGASECQLMLLRNYEPVCSFPTGYRHCVSTDPDTHHLLGGHLYTEFSTTTETVIKCDGRELFRYPGREILKGLVFRSDGGLYTLGQNRSGDGCTLRRNGVVLFRSEEGRIIGDFSHPASKGTGALYEVDGHLYWAFFSSAGSRTDCCLVKDNYATSITLPERARVIQDLRMGADGPCLLYTDLIRIALRCPDGKTLTVSDPLWQSAWIADPARRAVFAELGLGGDSSGMGFLYEPGHELQRLTAGGNSIYLLPSGGCAWVRVPSAGTVQMLGPQGQTAAQEECLFFSRSCAAVAGDRMWVALSPYGKDTRPMVWDGNSCRELEMEGFLSGLEVVLTPSR